MDPSIKKDEETLEPPMPEEGMKDDGDDEPMEDTNAGKFDKVYKVVALPKKDASK